MAYNDAVNTSTGLSPNVAFYGRALNLPMELPKAPTKEWNVMQYQEKLQYSLAKVQDQIVHQIDVRKNKNSAKGKVHLTFNKGDLVAMWQPKNITGLSKKLIPSWQGPLEVVHSTHQGRVYYLKNTEGKELPYPISVLRLTRWADRQELQDLEDKEMTDNLSLISLSEEEVGGYNESENLQSIEQDVSSKPMVTKEPVKKKDVTQKKSEPFSRRLKTKPLKGGLKKEGIK